MNPSHQNETDEETQKSIEENISSIVDNDNVETSNISSEQVDETKSNTSSRPMSMYQSGLDNEEAKPIYRSTLVAPPLGMDVLRRGHNIYHEPFIHTPPMPMFNTRKIETNMNKSKETPETPVFGPRVDTSNYMDVTPRLLPPAPFRLELHTHFHIKSEAIERICTIVGQKLCTLDTDFEFKQDKCKWKVDYRQNEAGLRVTLNIVIYALNEKKEFVLEVQRRTGDITSLMHFFRELRVSFKKNDLISERTSNPTIGVKRSTPSISLTPQPILKRGAYQKASVSIKNLLESKHVDVQIQGLLGAISLSATHAAHDAMANLVPRLVALGKSPREEVRRLVTVALSRLCDHPDCRMQFIQSEGWQFVVDCAAGGPNVKQELQRHSLQVVESLCELYHDELAQVEGAGNVLDLVNGWQDIEEPRLKKHAWKVKQALKQAGVIA